MSVWCDDDKDVDNVDNEKDEGGDEAKQVTRQPGHYLFRSSKTER